VDTDDESDRVAFLIGYLSHLAADNLWSEVVGQTTIQRHIAPSRDPHAVWRMVKSDWYDVDAVAVLRNPFMRPWIRFTHQSHATSHIDLVSSRDIAARMLVIRNRYTLSAQDAHLAMSRSYPYLNGAQSQRFVDVACDAVTAAVVRALTEDAAGGGVDKHSYLDRGDIQNARELVWEDTGAAVVR
jgi:hypothetical protein